MRTSFGIVVWDLYPNDWLIFCNFFLIVSFKFHIWNKFKYITKIKKNLQKLYMYMYIYATIKIMNR